LKKLCFTCQLRLQSVFVVLNYPAIFIMHLNGFLADTAAPTAPAAPAQTAPASTTTQGTTTAPGAPASPPPAQGIFGNPIILLVLVGVMMYFMLFRPQQQRAKQMAKLMASMKAGDRVVTSSGIVGSVVSVKDKTVTLRSGDAKMEVTKSSVTEILESSDATPTTSP
jgi:preprotein translocase subunit YajC